MASYHFTIKTDLKPDGTAVSASVHAEYVNREGKYTKIDQVREAQKVAQTDPQSHAQYINREAAFKIQGGCIHKEHHLPQWAEGSAQKFFEMADIYEHPRNTRYREIEFALPVELTLDQQNEIVIEFIQNHLGNDFYWALAIHDKEAAMGDGKRNPHCHLMFSERKIDEIERKSERDPETFFKGYNRYNPEKGGCRKDEKWNGPNRPQYTIEMRKDFALIQNKILDKYGFDVTVDHRSLPAQREEAEANGDHFLAQILNRAPERSIGPQSASQLNHPKVIELKQYRQLKREHQQLLAATKVLERSILKDETNESVETTLNQADITLSEIKKDHENASELQKLSQAIVDASKELAVVKNLIIWDGEALAMARRIYMTKEEIQVENEIKTINIDLQLLKRADRQLRETTIDKLDKIDTIQYEKNRSIVDRQLPRATKKAASLAAKLKEMNTRFSTQDYKIKLAKEQQKILRENQPAKDMAEDLQRKLDSLVTQTRAILRGEIEEKVHHIDAQMDKLLVAPLAEKATLAEKRITLSEEKERFYAKPKPTGFYLPDRIEWNTELKGLQEREALLNTREAEINARIDAIRRSVPEESQQQTSIKTPAAAIIADIRLTAKEVQDILAPELRSLKTELAHIEARIKGIEPRVISQARAQTMAQDIYTKGGFKRARAEEAEIKKEVRRIDSALEERNKTFAQFNQMQKPNWLGGKEDYRNMQEKLATMDQAIAERQVALAERTTNVGFQIRQLERDCTTVAGQAQIDRIAKGILGKNQPIARQYSDLIQKRTWVGKEITHLSKLKTAVDKQVKQDVSEAARSNKPEPQYKTRGSGAGGGGHSSANNLADLAKTIASAIGGDSKAVALVVRFVGHNEVDLSAMTDDQREEAIKKMQIERLE